jgi:serpin B
MPNDEPGLPRNAYASEARIVVVTTKDKPARAREFPRVASWLGVSLSSHVSLCIPPSLARAANHHTRGPEGRVARGTKLAPRPAAATAVETMRSMPTEYVKMVVDKPFVFALRDQRTGLILLMGYVERPTMDAVATSVR